MSVLEDLQELYNVGPDTERISLRGRALEHIDAELTYLQLHFANIRHLDLSDNALEWLPLDFATHLPKLVALDVTKNRFQSVAALGDVLQQCVALKSLSVTLESATDEKLLRVMLPKLRILNGTPLSSPASPATPMASATPVLQQPSTLSTLSTSVEELEPPVKAVDALSEVLLSPSTASNSSIAGGTDSPEPHDHALTRSTALSPHPPMIASPQDKRTLRLQFASLKLERRTVEQERSQATAPAHDATTASSRRRRVTTAAQASVSTSRPTVAERRTKSSSVRPTETPASSVRPTETPASISDDRTDWRKRLKSQSQSAPGTALTRAAATASAAAATTPPQPESTESFLKQLKAVVKAFHAYGATKTSNTQLVVNEQLDKHIDELAQQLSRYESQDDDDDDATSRTTRIAMLQTRWNLLAVCGQYGIERASSVDSALGRAVSELLAMQQHVLVALQHEHIASASSAHQLLAPTGRSGSQNDKRSSNAPTQQTQQLEGQMRVLLEVAESLESDLEAAQTRLQQERAQRELLEQANGSLQRENDAFRRQTHIGSASTSAASSVDALHSVQQNIGQTENRDASASSRQRIRKRVAAVDSATAATAEQPLSYAAESVPVRAAAPPVTHVRRLTLKQVVDFIQCITASKRKSDTRAFDVTAATATGSLSSGGVVVASGPPRETMEQHMYAYLNQRFGLHVLIVDYASAIWKACEAFAPRENDAAVFLALLRNELDEGFLVIKRKLQHALVDLLRAYFQAKHPLKQELAIAALVQSRVAHDIYEDEWRELLTYLYDPQDSSTLLRLVKQKAERLQTVTTARQRRKHVCTGARGVASTPLSLSFAMFEQVLFDYQLQGRIKLLEDFRTEFASYDADRVGIVTRDAFVAIARRVAPKKSDAAIAKLLETLDPFQHDVVTFSDAASCLMGDIRGKRSSSSKPPPPVAMSTKCTTAPPPPAPVTMSKAPRKTKR